MENKMITVLASIVLRIIQLIFFSVSPVVNVTKNLKKTRHLRAHTSLPSGPALMTSHIETVTTYTKSQVMRT